VEHRLDDDHEALRKTVEGFARDVVAPQAEHADRTGEFPYDVVRQMGEMGLFGLPFPEEYGGMGGDFLALCLAIEELARVDSSVAITLEAAVGLGSMPIFRFGSEEQ
jgi:alkylation response protein AidB-like acyl-CoA dehydrogenase